MYNNISIEDMCGEEWRDVLGFEGHYKVSTFGRVKGIKRGRVRIMRQYDDGKGYLMVHLRKPGVDCSVRVHRLVAEAFIPNPENKPEVDHKEGIKTDNRVGELRWATHIENIQNSCAKGTHGPKTATNIQHCFLIAQKSLDGELIKIWCGLKEIVKNTQVTMYSLRQSVKTSKPYMGFIWEKIGKNVKKVEDKVSKPKIKLGKDHPSAVKILQKDVYGRVIKLWYGAPEIKRTLGFRQQGIWAAIKGGKKYKEFYWERVG